MENQTPSTQDNSEAVFIFAIGIDQQTSREFAINLINWSDKNPNRALRININSQGGNILDSLFLREEFARLRKRGHYLTMAAYGRSASCAAWLLQAADKRIIGADSWLLIHEVTSTMNGSFSRSAIKAELDRVDELQAQTNELLCRRSKLTPEKILANIAGGKDWWLNARTSLNEGLVDEIEEAPPFKAAA